MTTWAGWAEEFLNTAIHGTTSHTVRFLHDWAAHAEAPNCGNNPIDLTHAVPGSKDCEKIVASGKRAYQAYANHADAAKAFSDQILTGPYPDIQAAIMSGHPYTFGDVTAIGNQLIAWGSPTFANFYYMQTTPAPGVLHAPQALKGWGALQKSLNRAMPHALTYSHHVTTASLRTLSRARKVRL